MCPRDKMERKIGMMEFSLFEKIIDESRGYVDFIYLHLFGEPLFHKDIFNMIEYAKKNGIKVGLSTNATELSEKNMNSLLHSHLDLLILSLDNPSTRAYSKVRVGGEYEKIENNVFKFLDGLKKVKNKPEVVLQMIDLDCTREEQSTFKEKFAAYSDIHIKIKGFSNWAGQVNDIDHLVEKPTIPISNVKCFEPWRALTIYWDGTVVPCCNDFDSAIVLGNVRNSTIKSIWNGEKMQELRKQHLKDKSSIDLCKLCPAVSYAFEECNKPSSPFYPYEREIEYYCK
jgi:radical SAM protein with 4Fe4S-binding SPASM domain